MTARTARVLSWLALHAGASQVGCADMLGLSELPPDEPPPACEACQDTSRRSIDAGCQPIVGASECVPPLGSPVDSNACDSEAPTAGFDCRKDEWRVPGEDGCSPVAPCPGCDFDCQSCDLECCAASLPPETRLVAAGAAPNGDGSLGAPFATIQEALDKATDDLAIHEIRVCPGTYPDKVRVDLPRPIAIRGVCARLNEDGDRAIEVLSDDVTVDSFEIIEGGESTIRVEGRGATLRSLWLHRQEDSPEPQVGIHVTADARDTTLSDLVIEQERWGVLVLGSATLDRVVVSGDDVACSPVDPPDEGGQCRDPPRGSVGVHVGPRPDFDEGSQPPSVTTLAAATLTRTVVLRTGRGVVATGDSSVFVDQGLVHDTCLTGLSVHGSGASMFLHRSVIDVHVGNGATVAGDAFGAASLDIEKSWFQDTRAPGEPAVATAIAVEDATLDARELAVLNMGRAGIWARGERSTVSVQTAYIEGPSTTDGEDVSRGVFLDDVSHGRISNTRIRGVRIGVSLWPKALPMLDRVNLADSVAPIELLESGEFDFPVTVCTSDQSSRALCNEGCGTRYPCAPSFDYR